MERNRRWFYWLNGAIRGVALRSKCQTLETVSCIRPKQSGKILYEPRASYIFKASIEPSMTNVVGKIYDFGCNWRRYTQTMYFCQFDNMIEKLLFISRRRSFNVWFWIFQRRRVTIGIWLQVESTRHLFGANWKSQFCPPWETWALGNFAGNRMWKFWSRGEIRSESMGIWILLTKEWMALLPPRALLSLN